MTNFKSLTLFLIIGSFISIEPAHSRKPKYKCEEQVIYKTITNPASGNSWQEYSDTVFHIYLDGEEIRTYHYNDGGGVNDMQECKNKIKDIRAGG